MTVCSWVVLCFCPVFLTPTRAAVVVEKQSGRLLVIDVNYFPGYKGMDDFGLHFVRYLRARADPEDAGELHF